MMSNGNRSRLITFWHCHQRKICHQSPDRCLTRQAEQQASLAESP
jgi:hypothetical protein